MTLVARALIKMSGGPGAGGRVTFTRTYIGGCGVCGVSCANWLKFDEALIN